MDATNFLAGQCMNRYYLNLGTVSIWTNEPLVFEPRKLGTVSI